MPRPDKRPLLAYMQIQERADREIMYVLKRSGSRIERELVKLEAKQGIGAAIRRDQLRMHQVAIHREIARLWRLMGSQVKAWRNEAAAAAIETSFVYEQMLWNAALSQRDVNILKASAKVQARRAVDVVETRILGYSKIPLSERVYKSRQLASGQIDRIINNALARGVSARELAEEVRPHIRMDTAGGVRYAAMRLARTELNNAFHATAVRHAIQSPAIAGMKWHLSGSHPKPDECDEYAADTHFSGGEPGVFKPKDVPAKPHPQCLCFVTPVTISLDEFKEQYKAGAYDNAIDAILKDGGMTFS